MFFYSHILCIKYNKSLSELHHLTEKYYLCHILTNKKVNNE